MATDWDNELKGAAAGGGGGAIRSTSGPLIPVRFPGVKYNPKGAGSVNAFERGMSDPGGQTLRLDPDSASVAINGWSEDDQRAIAKKMWSLGLIESPMDLAGAYAQWDNAVQVAARFAAAGNPMEVQDVMELVADGSPDAIKRRAMRNRAGGVVTQKANAINLSNPHEARALIEAAFQARMGRDPSEAELRTLTASLNDAQRKNPTTTTQTTHYGMDGEMVSQDSTTSGGIDAGQFISESTADDPEAASYMAATEYLPALMQLFGG